MYDLVKDGIEVYEEDGKIYIEDTTGEKTEWLGDLYSAYAEARRIKRIWQLGQ